MTCAERRHWRASEAHRLRGDGLLLREVAAAMGVATSTVCGYLNDGVGKGGPCGCGCGAVTNLARHTDTARGWVKGEPLGFVHGHGRRTKRLDYTENDLGHSSPCWLFSGVLDINGYGVVQRDNKNRRAHRYAYEQLVGPIPEGLVLDHLCRIKSCINPDHLEPVTHAENQRRGVGTKLTMAIARAVRESSQSQLALAGKYGVSPTTIRNIRANITWKEIA